MSPVPDALLLWSAPITLDDPFVPRILPPGVELGDVVPSQHVRPGLPPSVFIHGSEDRLVPPTVSIELSAALRAAGNRSEVRLIPGGDHFFIDPVLREALLDETVAALGGL